MKIDPRDFILQEHAPIIAAPAFGELEPLQQAGHRYIAARNGSSSRCAGHGCSCCGPSPRTARSIRRSPTAT
jgi:hypothetical protein